MANRVLTSVLLAAENGTFPIKSTKAFFQLNLCHLISKIVFSLSCYVKVLFIHHVIFAIFSHVPFSRIFPAFADFLSLTFFSLLRYLYTEQLMLDVRLDSILSLLNGSVHVFRSFFNSVPEKNTLESIKQKVFINISHSTFSLGQ